MEEKIGDSNKNYRIYFGKRFYKLKNGYWANSMPIHAHRWVWINNYGAIPSGMDIHHIDGDKDNNQIENLEILTRSDHLKKHHNEGLFDYDRNRKQLSDARKWLQTDEGRKKQSEASKKSWKYRKTGLKSCQECGKQFETKQPWAKYCRDACDKRWRRKQGLYNVEAKCPICDKIFLKDKFMKKIFCSISCGAKSSAAKRNKS